MAILPKEKPKSHKKKQSIETLKKMKSFLERESFDFARKDLAKKYEHPAISAVKEAASIVAKKHKKKIKNPSVLEMQQPIYRLATFQAILSPLLSLASISCMFFYKISKSSHDEALEELGIENE